jgi:glyoxylase-like metal-dependent hydrolase (beta-lactamase superfamily II)
MSQATSVIDFVTTAPVAGELPERWQHGARRRRRGTEPPVQVHDYDEHTVILRQSKLTSYEAPFLYLLFGNDRALLLDTGASKDAATFPLRKTVDELIARWLSRHPRADYPLVVAHTHGHGDHVAGDVQFDGRPDTVVVGREPEAVQQHFGFTTWPDQQVSYDLGGRVLQLIASPGHHRAAVTFYDPWTGWLLTGDTVIPGRLYASDYPQFLSTLDKLVAFAGVHEVTAVLGCHIEMTKTPGRDYPLGCLYQPDEAPLAMSAAQLLRIREQAHLVAGTRGRHVFADVIIYNQPGLAAELRLLARGLAARLAAALRRG